MNKVTDIVISESSFVSVHVQLHNQLRQLILSGRWANGSRIPSESQFSQHLNVSRTTVRLALQRAEIEGLIERAAGRGTFVAYVPSKERVNRIIAFVTYGFDGESHLVMLNGTENELKAQGYQLVLHNVQTYQEEMDFVTNLSQQNIDGILLWPRANAAHKGSTYSTRYQQLQIPMVLMDRQIYGMERDCVTSDNYGGARALMHHLLELGHEHITFLSHHEIEILPVKERYRAYCDVLQEAGFTPCPPCLIGQPGHEFGASYVLRASVNSKSPELQQIKEFMLTAQPRPTAIFAMNDYVAVLAMQAMKLLGLHVPDDVSIAGFDDIGLAVHLEPPLTTVAQDLIALGQHAARRLIDRLEGYSGPAECETLPTQLRIRSSTSTPVRIQT